MAVPTSACRSARSRCDPTAREEPYRAYDTSGPYTDPAVAIDLEAGLPPVRADWIAKRGFARIAARAVKDVDNGDASAPTGWSPPARPSCDGAAAASPASW